MFDWVHIQFQYIVLFIPPDWITLNDDIKDQFDRCLPIYPHWQMCIWNFARYGIDIRICWCGWLIVLQVLCVCARAKNKWNMKRRGIKWGSKGNRNIIWGGMWKNLLRMNRERYKKKKMSCQYKIVVHLSWGFSTFMSYTIPERSWLYFDWFENVDSIPFFLLYLLSLCDISLCFLGYPKKKTNHERTAQPLANLSIPLLYLTPINNRKNDWSEYVVSFADQKMRSKQCVYTHAAFAHGPI